MRRSPVPPLAALALLGACERPLPTAADPPPAPHPPAAAEARAVVPVSPAAAALRAAVDDAILRVLPAVADGEAAARLRPALAEMAEHVGAGRPAGAEAARRRLRQALRETGLDDPQLAGIDLLLQAAEPVLAEGASGAPELPRQP